MVRAHHSIVNKCVENYSNQKVCINDDVNMYIHLKTSEHISAKLVIIKSPHGKTESLTAGHSARSSFPFFLMSTDVKTLSNICRGRLIVVYPDLLHDSPQVLHFRSQLTNFGRCYKRLLISRRGIMNRRGSWERDWCRHSWGSCCRTGQILEMQTIFLPG